MTTEMRRPSATLEMVAARAGVSRATVSRVVNNSPRVSPEVVSLVTAAIAALDYVPNNAARSLARRRTQAIALIVPESTAKVFADPFFAAVVRGVATRLSETEYTLSMVIASEAHSDKTRRYLLGGNVDGALVVSHHSGDHSYTELGPHMPVVFGGRPLNPDVTDSYYVDVDNVAAAAMATRHLVERGCRRIATITGRLDMPGGIDRYEGYRRALAEAGLPEGPAESGDFSPRNGADAMQRILDRGEPIDGLFAANDQMAAGACSVLREAGLSIPSDVAVVGYDDDLYAATAAPPLTTVHQDPAELGARMADVLVRRIDGEDVPHATVVPTHLVVRESA